MTFDRIGLHSVPITIINYARKYVTPPFSKDI